MADHEHSVIKHSDHLLLDQPLLRLPYELLRNNFRSAHFAVEKENAGIKTLLKDAATGCLNGRSSPSDLVHSLDDMISQARALKRKLSTCAEDEARLLRQTEARIAHVDELYHMSSFDDVKYESWSRTRLDRLLVDYLLRRGYSDSATALAEERNMRDLVDVETFVTMARIIASLKAGSVQEALAWCTENKKELRKMDSNLEFMLRYQQYIELVRSQHEQKILKAVTHAKKYLIPYKELYPREVQEACGLLALPPTRYGTASYLSELYSPKRWEMLADLFTTAHNDLLALPSQPLLHIALSSGLSALKTPACHSHARKDELFLDPTQASLASLVQQSSCPICSTELNELARKVPYAHHTKSHVDHDLRVLPNGRVYGKERLLLFAKKAGLSPNTIKDPWTGEIYDIDAMQKVYIT